MTICRLAFSWASYRMCESWAPPQFSCTRQSGGTRQTGSVMNPNATGQIAADGPFDVVQAIPTSETANAV